MKISAQVLTKLGKKTSLTIANNITIWFWILILIYSNLAYNFHELDFLFLCWWFVICEGLFILVRCVKLLFQFIRNWNKVYIFLSGIIHSKKLIYQFHFVSFMFKTNQTRWLKNSNFILQKLCCCPHSNKNYYKPIQHSEISH